MAPLGNFITYSPEKLVVHGLSHIDKLCCSPVFNSHIQFPHILHLYHPVEHQLVGECLIHLVLRRVVAYYLVCGFPAIREQQEPVLIWAQIEITYKPRGRRQRAIITVGKVAKAIICGVEFMQGLKQSDLCIKALLSENVDHILSEPLMPAERDIGVYEVAKMGQKLIGNLRGDIHRLVILQQAAIMPSRH